MKPTHVLWLLFSLLIFQSNSCDQNFKKGHLNKNEIWWNNLNEYWKELFLRETDHLDDQINEQILSEVLLLKSFSANHYPIYNLEPVKKLIHLEHLSAGNTQITGLKPITHLSKLKSINFPNTPISDLTPLKHLNELEEVGIQQTMVSDLSPLSNAENLQVLIIHETEIKSIKAIMHLNRMSILNICGLNISQQEIDDFQKLNPECEIIK